MGETFSPDAFAKDEDGNWHCIKSVTIKGPTAQIRITEGMTFTRGIPYLGVVDIAERLEEESSTSSQPIKSWREISSSSEAERYSQGPSKKGEAHLPPRPSVM